MALLEIKKYPERVLKEVAAPVRDLDGALQTLIDSMIETMYAAPGIGLAAPQVDVSKRLVIIDVSLREGEETPLIILINPEVVQTDGDTESEEGCLSLPGIVTSVKRADRILVRGYDREGNQIEVEGEGLLSRVLQHEIDHLNGTLLIDRMSPIKREFYKKRLKKNFSKE